MDLTGIDLIEELHEDKCVEDDGVMFGGRRVKRSITAAVYIKDPLTCTKGQGKMK